MGNYAQYNRKREKLAEQIIEKLEQALMNKKGALTIEELLEEVKEPFTSITAREAIWKLIDQDIIELTPERKFQYIGNSNGHH